MEEVSLLSIYLPSYFRIQHMRAEEEQVTISAQTIKQEATCPDCKTPTQRVHSYYTRIPYDLPCGIYRVRLQLSMRRLRCTNTECKRKTFVERLPSFLPLHAQQTLRLTELLKKLNFEINGEAGARICHHLKIRVTPDTLIRSVRRTKPPVFPPPKIIGIDDWAKRKGLEYGTLIVDLEQRCPIEVLPDRTSESLEKWLKDHPTIEIVCRDRFSNYIKGITQGASEAIQIADRWHLLNNMSNALYRVCSGFSQELQAIAEQISSLQASDYTECIESHEANDFSDASAREKLFFEVKGLIKEGYSNRTIAKMLPIHRETVARYRGSTYLSSGRGGEKKYVAAKFEKYLLQRWADGCHSPTELWLEIKDLGFGGSLSSLYRFLVHLGMKTGDQVIKLKPKRLSARQAAWLLVTPQDQLNDYLQKYKAALLATYPNISEASSLASRFIQMIKEQEVAKFSDWLEDAQNCSISTLKNFARKLSEDFDAVYAALQYDWSNGQLEGQVNRLKTIKRLMYGRANFDLLRLRVLCA